MNNSIQTGNSITITASGTIASGDLVVTGSLIGVASADASSGEDVALETEGVFELPKASADEISVGNLLYWDSGNAELTKTAGTSSRPIVGVAAKAAAAGVATVYCKLGVHGLTGPAA